MSQNPCDGCPYFGKQECSPPPDTTDWRDCRWWTTLHERKSKEGWFIELRRGSAECKVWHNGTLITRVQKITIEMTTESLIPKVTLEIGDPHMGFTVEDPEVETKS